MDENLDSKKPVIDKREVSDLLHKVDELFNPTSERERSINKTPSADKFGAVFKELEDIAAEMENFEAASSEQHPVASSPQFAPIPTNIQNPKQFLILNRKLPQAHIANKAIKLEGELGAISTKNIWKRPEKSTNESNGILENPKSPQEIDPSAPLNATDKSSNEGD